MEKTEQANVVNPVLDLIKKAKLQSINLGLLLVSLLSMFFAWFSLPNEFKELAKAFGSEDKVDTSVNIYETSGFSDVLITAMTLVAIGLTSYVIYSVYSNKKIAKKVSLGIIVITAGVGALNFLLGGFHVLSENKETIDVGMGFYIFALANLAILAVNGYKAYLNKDAVLSLANGS
ncbi:MAG: hypothetical protein Q9M91_07235 [Candidatus Dojkabacteria bacterium]|nr:hypothetical protein [Candidatus Dojkabacteria bacterium]